jgi:hypothetical protein
MQCRSPAAVKNVTLRDQRKHIILVMVEAGGPLIFCYGVPNITSGG